MRALTRGDVFGGLTNERGRPLQVLGWWVDALRALDDPAMREILLWLVRQAGKSQFLAAVAASELMTVRDSYIVFVAASAEQAQAIFARKLRKPLERLAREMRMSGALNFTQRGIMVPELGSALEVIATNESTVPGRTVTKLIIDEARYISDDTYAVLAPSCIGAGGQMLIASTAGPPRGFFFELTRNPTPETFLYRGDVNENPEADAAVVGFVQRRLALISPAAARRELGNEFADDGAELIPAALIDAAVDDRLGELPTSSLPAYAFLDLSRKADLTSLVVVVVDKPQRPEAADHLVAASVQTWDPKASPTGETDFAVVRDALSRLPVRFPDLRKVLVDEGAEAGSVMPFAKSHPQLSMVIDGFVGSVTANQSLWSALVARLNAQTLSLPRHERLLNELRGLRREEFAFGSKWRVVDSSRRFHRDVSLALAGAVMAAGTTMRCPYCRDESCEYPMPPYGMVDSPHVIAWYEQHQPKLAEPEFIEVEMSQEEYDALSPEERARLQLIEE
jgi:hypothetical protein